MSDLPVAARHISSRADCMPPLMVMEVLERAVKLERQGRSVYHGLT